jgi:DNA-binding transcriptional MerR regulator
MGKPEFTVTELARLTDVEAHVIRYYSRIGLLTPVRNKSNGYKVYSEPDAMKVRFTRKAQSLGYSLKEIEMILGDAHQGHSPCPLVREIIIKRLEETQQKIKELELLQERMQRAMKEWDEQPNKVPDGNSICHLIEGFIDE